MNTSEGWVPRKGEVIGGRYYVQRQLGAGGMAVVLEATDLERCQRVAVKMLRASRSGDRQHDLRFRREAHITTQLHGHHVACVHDVGELPNGAHFIVMELLDGSDLRALMQHGRGLEPEDAVRLALAIASALMAAHAAGVVHRDLKPENLFVGCDELGRMMVRLIDFGVAKLQASRPAADSEELTTINSLLGTAPYMAPEQIRDARSVDGRADIWSLGVILYELLSGSLPFDGAGVMDVLRAIVARDPVPIAERVPGLDPALAELVGRCLRKNPHDRFATAAELVEALRIVSSELPRGPTSDRSQLGERQSDVSQAPTLVPLAPMRRTVATGTPCSAEAKTIAA